MNATFFYADPSRGRYAVWMEKNVIYADPYWDMAGGNVPFLRFKEYPIPQELVHDGKISREDLAAFLKSIREPVPPDVLPEWAEV